jgi:hypothetical protein
MAGYNCGKDLKPYRIRAFEVMRMTSKALILVCGDG